MRRRSPIDLQRVVVILCAAVPVRGRAREARWTRASGRAQPARGGECKRVRAAGIDQSVARGCSPFAAVASSLAESVRQGSRRPVDRSSRRRSRARGRTSRRRPHPTRNGLPGFALVARRLVGPAPSFAINSKLHTSPYTHSAQPPELPSPLSPRAITASTLHRRRPLPRFLNHHQLKMPHATKSEIRPEAEYECVHASSRRRALVSLNEANRRTGGGKLAASPRTALFFF